MNGFGALVFSLTMVGIIIWIAKKICDYIKN